MKPPVPTFLAILACTGFGACTANDPESGFQLPDTTVTSYDLAGNEVASDWSCLGTPIEDVPLAVDVTATGVVTLLNSDLPVPDIEVSAFSGSSWDETLDSDVSDENGAYSLTVPAGTRELGMRLAGEGYLTVFSLSWWLDPETTEQEVNLETISIGQATGVAAAVGLLRISGTGLVLGSVFDCQGHFVSGAIATVSTTEGEAVHASGVSSFYFDDTLQPAAPKNQPYTNPLGLFLVAELPPSSSPHWLQVWGFLDQADLEAGDLTLLAEHPVPMRADSAVSVLLAPL